MPTRDPLPAPLARILEFHPVLATEKGVHAHDHRLASYAPEQLDTYVAGCRAALQDVERDLAGATRTAGRIDLAAMRANLALELFWLVDVRWHEVNPLVYLDEALNGLHVLLLQEHRPRPHRLPALEARLAAIPRLFREARRHLRHPWRLFTELALEAASDGETFLSDLARSQPELSGAVRDARRALDSFARFLARALAGAEERIALGPDLYARLIEIDFLIEPDTAALKRAAGEALAQLAPAIERRRARRHRLEPVPGGFSRDDVLAYYRWEIDQVLAFVRARDLVRVPDGPVAIVESPDYLDALLPAVSYQAPPPYEPERTGYLFLSPIPHPLEGSAREEYWRERSLRAFRKDVVHELYPGHHLQMTLAADHPSAVRRFQSNDLFVEGWALYCEELMEAQGLYGDEAGTSAFAVFFRAARVLVDTNLQNGVWSVKDAIGYLRRTLGREHESWFRREVHRYLTEPGQAMTYFVGKLAIDRMRARAEADEGRGFCLRRFHDRLLAQGSVQPALVEAALFGGSVLR